MNKEQKIEQILQSMEGHKPALPPTDLFAKIESQLGKNNKSVPLFRVKLSAAAAILLLCINTSVIVFFSEYNAPSTNQSSANSNIQLIDNYNLYSE